MQEEIKIDGDKFHENLDKLITHWQSQKTSLWNGADALCIPLGARQEEGSYSKSQAFHLYFFGIEDLTDSLIVLTKTDFYFMSNSKKCNFLKDQLSTATKKSEKITNFYFLEKTKDEGMVRENFNRLIGAVRKNGGKTLGTLLKEQFEGSFVPMWMDFVTQSQIDKVEVGAALGLFFAAKDTAEIELCRRAAVLTNKILKHSFVESMEDILEKNKKVSHEELSKQIEDTILDPSKIGVKVSPGSVDVCYAPIVQSGGEYDIKISAVSNSKNLTGNVVLCSVGARYKSYCAHMSRTYLVDPPTKVEKTYQILVELFHQCLDKMIKGNELKDVYEKAREFLKKKNADLLQYLPKTLGFAMGIEFRDSTLLLNQTNEKKFAPGMVFSLSLGFHNVPLTAKEKDTKGDFKAVDVFSLLLSDIVVVQDNGVPEVFTKAPKELDDIRYNTGNDDDESEAGDESGEDAPTEPEDNDDEPATGRRTRGSSNRAQAVKTEAARGQRQMNLIRKKNAEGAERMRNGGGYNAKAAEEEVLVAKDLKVFKTAQELPRDLVPNRLKIDMEHEALIIPLNGRHVPFHISTVKTMAMADGDLRIVFYTSGGALGKDAPKNMQALVAKYGETCSFIKEVTFRSADDKNLTTVHQQYQELRKRIRQRELKAEQEKDLVVQETLIKIRDQKLARLQEVSMYPVISGRKCVGSLEAHQNGLRFTSNKGELIDVMYRNIKHCIFQPCDGTTKVLVHFHLKDPIMVGKKKVVDVQFFTEVIDASENLEGNRASGYDPDEIEMEQREKEMKKKLNSAFKDFCLKVEKVAEHFNYHVRIDVPFKKSSFQGNLSKDMVTFMPTANCLVSLADGPVFVITLKEIEHAHLERISYGTRNFDLVLINRNWDIEPVIVTAIEMKYLEIIEEWLLLMEITTTKGPRNMNWKEVMKSVRGEPNFYEDHDEDGESKPAGWLFLSAEGDDEEEEDEDDDDAYSSNASDSDDDSDDDDSDDSGSSFDDEDDESSGYDDEDDLSEEGQSWEELEERAKRDDKQKQERDAETARSAKRPAPSSQGANKKMRR